MCRLLASGVEPLRSAADARHAGAAAPPERHRACPHGCACRARRVHFGEALPDKSYAGILPSRRRHPRRTRGQPRCAPRPRPWEPQCGESRGSAVLSRNRFCHGRSCVRGRARWGRSGPGRGGASLPLRLPLCGACSNPSSLPCGQVCIGYAQNFVEQRRCADGALLAAWVCAAQGVAYCMQVAPHSGPRGEWLIVSGTPMGDVHLWALDNALDAAAARAAPAQALPGSRAPRRYPPCAVRVRPCVSLSRTHAGSVFSLHLDTGAGLLLTAGDDRRFRLWRVQVDAATGLPNSLEETVSAFAHDGRVWAGRLWGPDWIVTCGEDSKGCVRRCAVLPGCLPAYGHTASPALVLPSLQRCVDACRGQGGGPGGARPHRGLVRGGPPLRPRGRHGRRGRRGQGVGHRPAALASRGRTRRFGVARTAHRVSPAPTGTGLHGVRASRWGG